MPLPFVSILIDTYNHERFIAHAISSVLAQDYPADCREIVVVDDGSTDKTLEILRNFGEQVRIIAKSNGGQASAFNAGIPQCRGEIIFFLDGDDWWLPGKLRRIASLMTADPLVGAVGHAITECFDNGAEHLVAPVSQVRFRLDSVGSADFFRLNRCYFGTSRLTLRASLARKILPVPEALVFEADEYLFTLAPALADALLLPDPLTCYRLHSANLYMAPVATYGGLRRKQQVIAALATELRRALPACGVTPEVASVVLEIVDAEASQLHLQLDGGWSWETFRVESTLYRLQHRNVPWRSRVFRSISMIPALLLPPRWFYSARRWLGSKSWYLRARKSVLPSPAFIPSFDDTSPRGPAPPQS